MIELIISLSIQLRFIQDLIRQAVGRVALRHSGTLVQTTHDSADTPGISLRICNAFCRFPKDRDNS